MTPILAKPGLAEIRQSVKWDSAKRQRARVFESRRQMKEGLSGQELLCWRRDNDDNDDNNNNDDNNINNSNKP